MFVCGNIAWQMSGKHRTRTLLTPAQLAESRKRSGIPNDGEPTLWIERQEEQAAAGRRDTALYGRTPKGRT